MKAHFLMLGYRYWLEGRTRFFIAVALLALIIVYAFNQADGTIQGHAVTHAGREINFTQYVWVIIYKGYFLTIFTLASFLFGVGGPNQEKANGNALFTLSLPIFRKTLVRAKIAIASLQVISLSLVAALLIPILASLFQFNYPLKDAVFFCLLMCGGGFIFMILGFGLSLFLQKQMVIIPIGVVALATVFFITKIPALKTVNIFNFMVGAGYLSNDDFLFNQPINFLGLCMICCVVLVISLGLEFMFKQMDL